MPTGTTTAVQETPPSNVRPYSLPMESKRKKITEKELLERVKGGQLLLVAEYRSTKTDLVKWVDKTTGKPMSFVKCEHHVEADIDGSGTAEAFVCEERQPKELVDPAGVHIGLRKGQTVALHLQSIRRDKGHSIASVDGLNGVLILGE